MVRYDPNDYDPNAHGRFEPIPDGDYAFSVVNATESTSKNGNPMITLEMVFDVGREKELTVFDRLVFVPAAIWKVAQFCQATGLDFGRGDLEPEDAFGSGGTAHLALGEENSKGKRYMEVDEYLQREGYSEQPAGVAKPAPAPYEPPPPGLGEEDIPF